MGKSITNYRTESGGCINQAFVLEFKDHSFAFCKTGSSAPDMYEKEARGLKEIKDSKAIRVPEVICAHKNFLLLEFIPQQSAGSNTLTDLGHAIAKMHKHSSDHFGFNEDNFIGSTPQKNTPPFEYSLGQKCWTKFYFEYRLLYQIELAQKNGFATSELMHSFESLHGKLDSIISDDEPPCLLHGDLWGGNYITTKGGEPCLIDPAVYYGHREAELAMTSLFGGFGSGFYQAYEEQFPLQPEWKYRQKIYQLYHLLNHLNIFGQGYYGQVLSAIRFYL